MESTNVGYEFAVNYCCRLYEDPATIHDFYHPEAHSRSSLLHASPDVYDYNVGQKARVEVPSITPTTASPQAVADSLARLHPKQVLTLIAQVDVQPVHNGADQGLMLRLAGVQSVQGRPFRGFQQVLVLTCIDAWWRIGGDLHCWLAHTPNAWIHAAQQHFKDEGIPPAPTAPPPPEAPQQPPPAEALPEVAPAAAAPAAQPIPAEAPPADSPLAPSTPPMPLPAQSEPARAPAGGAWAAVAQLGRVGSSGSASGSAPVATTAAAHQSDGGRSAAEVPAESGAPLTYAQRVKAAMHAPVKEAPPRAAQPVRRGPSNPPPSSIDSESTAGQKAGRPLRSDDSCGIMVRNLPGTTTREELRGLFGRFGTIADTHVKPTHDGRAYAFVVFSTEAARNAALRDPPLVEGRPALVMEKRRGVGRGRRGDNAG